MCMRAMALRLVLVFRPVSPLSGHSHAAGRRGSPTLSPGLDSGRHTSLELQSKRSFSLDAYIYSPDMYQQHATGGSWPEKYVERGFVARKGSSKHILKHTKMPRGQSHNCFNFTPRTPQVYPGYPWGIWESIHERVSRRNIV